MTVRRLLSLAAVMVAILLPLTAHAQRVRPTPGTGGEGMPFRDCSQGASSEDTSVSTGPSRAAISGPGTQSVEDAVRLRQRVHDLNQERIRRFDSLLGSMPADYPRRADVLFQKAEALKEVADTDYMVEYARFNECMQRWYICTGEQECYEPLHDYDVAIEGYREIARNHPSYERIDEVIFRLGELLMENEQGSDGVSYLQNLVQNYQRSNYLCEAYKLMGDHFFDKSILTAARQNYDEALKFTSCDLYNQVLYGLAWVDINESLHADALQKLQTVVARIDQSTDKRQDFRNQALNDMLICFAELDNGWQMARDYYEQREGQDMMRRKLTKLAELFDTQGKNEQRVQVLGFFLERFAMDDKVPQWAEETLDSLSKIGDWDRYESRAREFIALFDPRSSWSLQKAGSDRALSNARLLAENTLLAILNRNYQEAERLKTQPATQQALLREVERDYDEFFRRFPDSREAYERRFDYAELLYYKICNQGQWSERYWLGREEFDTYLRRAGDVYKSVVEMQPDPAAPHAHDSAVGALQVYDDFMKREVPDIGEPLPPPDRFQFVAERELGKASTDYVDIVAWFAKLYPADDLIPEASWRAAALFLRNGHIGEAAERFETIIEHHPRHRFAQEAGLAAFVCYQHVKNYGKIESVARTLLNGCKGSRDLCKEDQLKRNIAYAMDMQANEAVEQGQQKEISGDRDGALASFMTAAEKRVALYREFPTSEFSAAALYNAAATYEQARRVEQSISLYNEFLAAFDRPDVGSVLDRGIDDAKRAENVQKIRGMIPEAKFTLALIHDSQAHFEVAADWFEKVDAYADFDDRPVAVFRAARLREALGQTDRALQLYDHYVSLKQGTDNARDTLIIMAEIEAERNNLDAAYAVYQRLVDAAGTDNVRKLISVYKQAEIRRTQGKAEQALALYRQVYNMFGVGTLGFGADGRPTGWTTRPGGNFVDETQRKTVLPYAAGARFRLAEVSFAAAQGKDLSYREGRWQQLAQKLADQGEANNAAQKEMFEVMEFGDAQWAVAGATRIGELYFDFYKKIGKVETVDVDECIEKFNATYEQCDELATKIDEKIYELQEPLGNKAKDAFDTARRVSVENRVYTEWTQRLLEQLHDLDRSNRLGGAEGVGASKTADIYTGSTYIVDLSAKLAAFEQYAQEQAEQQRLLQQQQQQTAPGGGAR